MRQAMVKVMLRADALGLTDPDCAWLPIWWLYKAAVAVGL